MNSDSKYVIYCKIETNNFVINNNYFVTLQWQFIGKYIK